MEERNRLFERFKTYPEELERLSKEVHSEFDAIRREHADSSFKQISYSSTIATTVKDTLNDFIEKNAEEIDSEGTKCQLKLAREWYSLNCDDIGAIFGEHGRKVMGLYFSYRDSTANLKYWLKDRTDEWSKERDKILDRVVDFYEAVKKAVDDQEHEHLQEVERQRAEEEREFSNGQRRQRMMSYEVHELSREAFSILNSKYVRFQLNEDAIRFVEDTLSNAIQFAEDGYKYGTNLDLQRAGTLLANYGKALAEATGDALAGLQTGFFKGFYNAAEIGILIYSNPKMLESIPIYIMNTITNPTEFMTATANSFKQFLLAYSFKKGEALGSLFADTIIFTAALNAASPFKETFSHIAKSVSQPEGNALGEALVKVLEKSPKFSRKIENIRASTEFLKDFLGENPRIERPSLEIEDLTYVSADGTRRVWFDVESSRNIHIEVKGDCQVDTIIPDAGWVELTGIEDSAGTVFGANKDGISNFLKIVGNEIGSVGPDISGAIKKIKDPSIWTETKYRTSVENALKHWQDHKGDFPHLNNALEYVEEANNFIKNPPSGTLIKTRVRDGSQVFYHPESNTFAIRDHSGAPRTMYKPDPASHGRASNMEYFDAQ